MVCLFAHSHTRRSTVSHGICRGTTMRTVCALPLMGMENKRQGEGGGVRWIYSGHKVTHSRMDNRRILLWSLTWICLMGRASSLQIDKCQRPLGMQTGEIPDSAITASSSYQESVGAPNARIRAETNGGAWCPKETISSNVYEYLQIDMGELKVVTLVETMGRFGNGQGQEYADQYLLEYQREDDGPWMRFHSRKAQEIFQGNTNTYTAEPRQVDPPIIARRIRFIPYSTRPKTVCMRVELHGCTWTDGIVSYNMTQGERRGSGVDLVDLTYDGQGHQNYLSGGLGQLTDGQEGQWNFRLDSKILGIRGYEWVGWRNETFLNVPVELAFKFDATRNFSSMRIYANNMFNKDVRVFRMAKVYFSIGGVHYLDPPLEFQYMRDTLMEYARPVIIPLRHNVGRYVKVQLFFDAKWMLISEVQFESEYAIGNFTPEVGPTAPASAHVHASTLSPNLVEVNIAPGMQEDNASNTRLGNRVPGDGDTHAGNYTPTTTVLNTSKARKSLDDQYIGIIIGALAALILLLFVVIVIIILRHRRHTNTSREYAVPHAVDKSSLIVNMAPNTNSLQAGRPPTLQKVPPGYHGHNVGSPYATSDVLNLLNIQGVSGNNVYAVPNNLDLLWTEDFSVMEFPRENLQFVEKLGEGQFGEVHLCEAKQVTDFLGDDFLVNRTGSRNMLVAVKMLRPNASEQARRDFDKEVKIMSRMKDPNIVRVLGMCTADDPMCVMVEYMKYGDLNQFLHQHILEGMTNKKKRMKVISYGGLIYMASQVASGMKYLESLNMVHRDLATRNCLVGSLYTIKISDFGMSRSLYSSDYYRIEGKAVLPIRWMAWESILLGKFSTKSDVWSFGVTLWEILTFAREQPYDNISDEQVIENCGHYFRNDGKELYLANPPQCPREIYDLMRECWNREEVHRPSFREIHMFMQRKNMGYDPRDEADLTATPQMNVPVV